MAHTNPIERGRFPSGAFFIRRGDLTLSLPQPHAADWIDGRAEVYRGRWGSQSWRFIDALDTAIADDRGCLVYDEYCHLSLGEWREIVELWDAAMAEGGIYS